MEPQGLIHLLICVSFTFSHTPRFVEIVLLLPDRAAFHQPCLCSSGLVQRSRGEQHGPGAVLSVAEYSMEYAATGHFISMKLGARCSCAASFLPQMDAQVLFVRSMFVQSQEQRVWI